MKKHLYNARWAHPGKPSLGNVSFEATSDHAAKVIADGIASEIGLPNTPRTLSRGSITIEVLQTGRANPK